MTTDRNDTRPTAHRLTVTPATLRKAEALGFEPGSGDVLDWALREVDRLQLAVAEFQEWSQAGPYGCPPYSSSLAGYLRQLDASFAALRDIEDRIREGRNTAEAERDAAREELDDFMRDVRRRHENRAVNLAYSVDRLASLDADALRALVVATARELDDTYAAFDRMASSSIRADLQGAEARDELVRVTSDRDRLLAERTGEVWMWNGDGHDDPDSLSCPVLMTADQVRELVAERDAASRDLARIVQLCRDAVDHLEVTAIQPYGALADRLRVEAGARPGGFICGVVVRERMRGNVITRILCPLPPGHDGDHAEALAGDD